MSQVFDLSELNDMSKNLYELGANFKKKEKKFLEKEGNYLRSNILSESKKHRKPIRKLYQRAVKRGKFYRRQKTASIRVYGGTPHFHLIENGHRMVTHDGKEVGFVKGTHAMETASKKFEPFFLREVEAMIEEAWKDV